jgi:futalosine hydrolase
MKPIIVVASTTMELALLLEQSAAVPIRGIGRLTAFVGEICGREIILALTGIGKVNASWALTVLLERFSPELVINTGCGGAYQGKGLAVGDLAIAASETFADEGVQTLAGWRGLELIGIALFKGGGGEIFNTFPLSQELAAQALACAVQHGFAAVVGPFLTVSTCSGSTAYADQLLRRYSGICENMEGAALAQVALIYDVLLLEVRAISNMVEDRDLTLWELKLAATRAQEFILTYLER